MDIPAISRHRLSGISEGTRDRAAIIGHVTVPGSADHVAGARSFVARALAGVPGVDVDAATLLTSELVTNAIQHTNSGAPNGTVTVILIHVPDGVLVEVADEGSADAPVVKGDLYAAQGHGLYLVQQLSNQWGYLRAAGGTTVWFYLGYLVTAATAASTAAQTRARSSSRVRYGGMV
jgi:anti-sigma regulatory factor (Ser/Thr protein kinase)